uniref:25S rRNA (uridine-N(3))-methyltransferase BMT5-like domain-containing protein n=1 Tax=Cannabis sativa TaxID=3483 RepID=A0A803QI83_CANSA
MSRRNRDRWIGEYNSSQQILLVGEGDFSFSAYLAKASRYADNMVATSLDSLDVHDMDRHPTLNDMKFDVIVFNFPHAGMSLGYVKGMTFLFSKRHKNLVGGFFRSASKMIKKGGEIHITHRGDEPYNQWEVEKLAQNEGLILKQKVSFLKELYLGYHNKRGSTIQGNKKFPLECSFTSKFSLPHHDIIHYHPKTTAIVVDHEKISISDDQNDIITLISEDHVQTQMISIANNNNVSDRNITDDTIIDGEIIAPTNRLSTLTISEHDHQNQASMIGSTDDEHDVVSPVGDHLLMILMIISMKLRISQIMSLKR